MGNVEAREQAAVTSDHPQPTTVETVVRESPALWAAIWVGFPMAGAATGWALVAIADWVTSLPWAPMQGAFELVERFSGAPLTIGAIVVGAVAGLLLALTGAGERLVVTVTDRGVRLQRDQSTTGVERAKVAAVFLDGKELVLQARSGEELAREKSDLAAPALAAAFRAHHYLWLDDGDPYAVAFRPWVDGADGLPPGANAVLQARSTALDQDEPEHVADLRIELARLGVVVRDQKKRQFWRPTAS